jgi:uncharacterized protein (UPF0332 family)
MTVSSADFLAFATECHAAGNEIGLRNCISRAYYGVYHAAFPVADAHCPDPNQNRQMGDHQRLIDRFMASQLKDAKKVGYVLQAMKIARHRADYDLGVTVTQSEADQTLRNAKVFAGHLSLIGRQTGSVAVAAQAAKP